jgi:hypothetical protein
MQAGARRPHGTLSMSGGSGQHYSLGLHYPFRRQLGSAGAKRRRLREGVKDR